MDLEPVWQERTSALSTWYQRFFVPFFVVLKVQLQHEILLRSLAGVRLDCLHL